MMDKHSDYPNIVRQLNNEEISDTSAVGRIVTALIASFALLSFVFILWYAYAEGKKQGLANIQQHQIADANLAPATSVQPSVPVNQSGNNLLVTDQNIELLDNSNKFPPSYGNDFAQRATSNNDIPRDPTQPIPLSSPGQYKKNSDIPPPPSVTNEPFVPQKASQSNQEIVESVTVPKVAAIDKPAIKEVAIKAVPKETNQSSETSSDDYGYITGSDFADQWRVQLASLRTLDATNDYWKQKKGSFPSILGGFRLQVEKVVITGKGDFYRLRIGPFLSRAEATKTCASLKNQKTDCFIVRPS